MRFYYSNKGISKIKVLLIVLAIIAGCSSVRTQEKEIIVNTPEAKTSQDKFSLGESVDLTEYKKTETESQPATEIAENDFIKDFKFYEYKSSNAEIPRETFLKPEIQKLIEKQKIIEKKENSFEPFSDESLEQFETNKQSELKEKFHWKPALIQSLYFLGIKHGFRMFEEKTHSELDGKFFHDWGRSVKNLGGWRDGDSFRTNYIAHPMQGAVTGRIFVINSDKSKKLEFGKSKDYWESRFKAMAWSAVWSTQFEIGPISEASIGNVGLHDHIGPNRMGWVDMVITPTAGTGVLIGEDIIDKYILKNWLERKLTSRTRIKIYRTFFTPFQSFTNVLAGRAPWRRDNR